jgi:hypothetical protein
MDYCRRRSLILAVHDLARHMWQGESRLQILLSIPGK